MRNFIRQIGKLFDPDKNVPAAVEYSPSFDPAPNYEVNDTHEAYQKTYEQVAWVYMAVSAKAENAARVPLIVRDRTSQEEFPDHLLAKMLKCPNPHDTGSNFRALSMAYLELTGNFYVEKVWDQAGLLRNLYALDSARTVPVPDPVTKVKGYSVRLQSGEYRSLTPDRVLHFKYPNPNNTLVGIGRLSAARMGVTLDLLTERYNKAFFDNNATPAALLIPEEPIGISLLNRVRNLLRREFQGVHRQHGIGVIGANMRLEKIGISPKDIEFLAQQQFSRDKIGSMFHVPPIYMGNFAQASYANADAQRKMFWEVTILPWLEWWLEYINVFLVPAIDPDVEVIIDRAAVIPLVESFESLTHSLLNLRNSGFITTNEGRRLLGMDPIDEESADVILIPGQFRPVKLEDTTEPTDGNSAPQSDPQDAPAPDPAADATEEAIRRLAFPNRVRELLYPRLNGNHEA